MAVLFRVHWLSVTIWGVKEYGLKMWQEWFEGVYADPIAQGNPYFGLELPGSACDAVPDKLLQEFVIVLERWEKARITRLDLAWDGTPFTPEQVKEARLGRLLITGKITEEAYDKLRLEWQEKLRNVELGLAELERDAKVHLDDLDLAIGLLRELVDYYFWLEDKQKSTLLQILFKRLVVDEKGSLIDYELNSPFVYLRSLADRFAPPSEPSGGSVHIREGAYAAPDGAAWEFLPSFAPRRTPTLLR